MPVRANGGHLTHFVMVHHSAQSAGGGTEKALCGHAPKNTTGMLRGRWIDDPLDRDREGVAPLSVPGLSRDMCKACVAKLPSWHKLRKQPLDGEAG